MSVSLRRLQGSGFPALNPKAYTPRSEPSKLEPFAPPTPSQHPLALCASALDPGLEPKDRLGVRAHADIPSLNTTSKS